MDPHPFQKSLVEVIRERVQAGMPRNFIPSSTDSPAAIDRRELTCHGVASLIALRGGWIDHSPPGESVLPCS
jgi:hypothetical protein